MSGNYNECQRLYIIIGSIPIGATLWSLCVIDFFYEWLRRSQLAGLNERGADANINGDITLIKAVSNHYSSHAYTPEGRAVEGPARGRPKKSESSWLLREPIARELA